LTVCENGYGKRTMLSEYRSQTRGGKGLIDIKTSDRNGRVVAVSKVTDDDEVMITTTGGILIRTRVADTRPIGRNTQGVRLIRLDEGHLVSGLAKIPEEELAAEAELAEMGEEDLDAETPERNGDVELADGNGKPAHILGDGVPEANDEDEDPEDEGEAEE